METRMLVSEVNTALPIVNAGFFVPNQFYSQIHKLNTKDIYTKYSTTDGKTEQR
jgi:hypothetical protein